MKKQFTPKSLAIMILVLLLFSSVNIIYGNELRINKFSEKHTKYNLNNLKQSITIVIPILKINNIYILIENKNENGNKVLVKGEISIGRPSGGD